MYYYFINDLDGVYPREEAINSIDYPQYIELSEDEREYYLGHPYASKYDIIHNAHKYTFEEVLLNKLNDLMEYDSSDNVNIFYIGDKELWLDKETRVGLQFSLDMEEKSGKTHSKLWYGTWYCILPINIVRMVLNKVEIYAHECYNVTQNHINNIKALTTIEDITAYDYTIGYPEKLHL